MDCVQMNRTGNGSARRSVLGLAAAAVMGAGLVANAQLPVTDGLIVWLKADAVNISDTATQVRIDGSDIYVKQWTDQSGNSHPASNGTEGDQPKYIANGLNGMPVLRFAQDNDDNGDRLYLGDLSASFPAAGSLFAVATPDNDGRYNLFGNRGNDERWIADTYGNESRPGSFRNARSDTDAAFARGSWPTSGSHVFSLESGSAVFRVLIDGAVLGSNTGDYHSGSGANWTIANRATNGQQLRGDIPELILFNRILTPAEADLIGGYLAAKYRLLGTTYPLPTPTTPSNLVAVAAAGSVDLSWAAATYATSYNVKRSSASGGTYTTIGTSVGTAYSDSTCALGVTNYYVVTAVNSAHESGISNEAECARLIATGNAILSMQFGALGYATISGTNILKNVSVGTDVTALAPTYTVSLKASEDAAYPSGTARNFTTPQTYTVTAENGSPQAYVVKIFKTDLIAFDFNGANSASGLQGWTQIWPAPPVTALTNLWENGHLGSGHDAGETRAGRSPEFHLTNLGDLTFQLDGGQSPLAAPAVAPDSIPELAINGGGFAGVALRDVAANTYVLSRRKTFSGGVENLRFSASELAPYANDGRKYTLDYIDYNKGGWGWTYLDNVSIPGTRVIPLMTGMTYPPFDPAIIDGTNITLFIAFGIDLHTFTPIYTTTPVAPFATGSPASGTPQDFTSGPVAYTLVSADGAGTNVYAVRVVALPDPAGALVGHWVSFAEDLVDRSGNLPGKHDGAAVGNGGGLAYSPDVPPGFAGSSLDLTATGVGVRINNSSTNDAGYANTFDEGVSNQLTVTFWAKGFPANWEPWVAKRGDMVAGVYQGWQVRRQAGDPVSCFTLRGLDNADGTGSPINVNDYPAVWHHFAGVWNQQAGTRTLYVDGRVSHVVKNAQGQTMVLAPGQALTLGARADGGTWYQAFFNGLLYDVRIYKQALFSNQVHTVKTTPLAAQDPEGKLTTFGLPGWLAPLPTSGGNVVWIAPFGTDPEVLAPTFTVSSGATCNRSSGVTNDFTHAQGYTVISSDLRITNVYSIIAKTGWTFNDGTLQGWHNRVWDTNANASAGGWVDLEPNATTMTNTVNGGVLQPPSADNGLYVPGNGVVWVSGQIDNHLNTFWLRSPVFYLNRSGDLTVRLAQGIAHTTAPANEAAVPFAAVQDGGWMGVILRRVSDGVFVLAKSKTEGQSGVYFTTTFTQAELAPLSSIEPYTLELINSDKGGWGWVTMDNVSIPGSAVRPPIGLLIMLK